MKFIVDDLLVPDDWIAREQSRGLVYVRGLVGHPANMKRACHLFGIDWCRSCRGYGRIGHGAHCVACKGTGEKKKGG